MKPMSVALGGILLGSLAAPAQAQRPEQSAVSRGMTVDGIVVSYNAPRGVIQLRRADGRLDFIEMRRARISSNVAPAATGDMTSGSAAVEMASYDSEILPESRIRVYGVETPQGTIIARNVSVIAPPENLARIISPFAPPPQRIAINARGGLAAPLSRPGDAATPREMVAGERLETRFDPAERLAEETPASFQGAILTGVDDEVLFQGEETVGFTASVTAVETDPSRLQLRMPSGNTITLRNDGGNLSGIRTGSRMVFRAARQDGLWTIQSAQPL